MKNGNENDDLDKIDRWNSVPLDVHKWSDHSEIKSLCDDLYQECGIDELEPRGNRKPARAVKDMLRVLILDLYVNWLRDPELSIGFSKDKTIFKVKGNRYNQVFISDKIIPVEAKLVDASYIEELPHYHDKTGSGRSYTTRIRHSEKLRDAFKELTTSLYDIEFDDRKELIVLHQRFTDEYDQARQKKLDYTDTDYTNQIREQLKAYNALLRRTFIDIPSLTEPYVLRQITKGKRAGKTQRISIGPDNKHVHRVFNGTEEDNWSKGGRLYGGWWLQIPKAMRQDIYINDQPTVEVDYKALHPNLLMNDPVYDPYDLEELVNPDLIDNLTEQRDVVKQLILMAINADSAKKAFQAFRNDQKKGDPHKKLKDRDLTAYLDAFTDKFPELKEALNTGKALELMNTDSVIANMVTDYFTKQDIPVLCIHDSFIIQYDKEAELRRVLHDASVQVSGKGIAQDSKANLHEVQTYVQGNIEGYEERRLTTFSLPARVKPTEQYKLRKSKHHNWLNS